MTYSIDLRERVVSFIKAGGSKVEASHRFKVSRRVVHYWLKNNDLSPKKHGFRHRKIHKKMLAKHVEDHPNDLLRERAIVFKVDPSAISYALKSMRNARNILRH